MSHPRKRQTVEERRAVDRAYYVAHRDEVLARVHAYRVAHADKVRAADKAWRDAHRDERNAASRSYHATHKNQELAYRSSHRNEVLAQQRAYRSAHKDERSAYEAAHRDEALFRHRGGRLLYRISALLAYGWSCACCGEDRYEFLVIDHVNGGGNKHRNEIGGGHLIYYWLADNDYPQGFQVLCQNCNSARGHYGYCPHEEEKEIGSTWGDFANAMRRLAAARPELRRAA